MGTARVKQEEEEDTRIIVIECSMKYGKKERGHEGGKSPKQDLTSAKDLIPEGRESSYHRLDSLTNVNYSLIYGPESTIIDISYHNSHI